MAVAHRFSASIHGERTFEYQDSLPSLPLPTLKQTLEKYLESVRPFLDEGEYKQTAFLVSQFESGVGAVLHKRLLERVKTSRNWLQDWWEHTCYLNLRTPLAPCVNIGGPAPYFSHVWPAKEGTQIERAAICLYYTIEFWQILKKEELKPDRNRNGDLFCMNQIHCLFSSYQIPGKKHDQLAYYFQTESEGDTSSHIIVMCKGRIFHLKVVDDMGHTLTPPEFQKHLQYILDLCDRDKPGPSLGVLTAHYRNTWAVLRNRIISLHPENWTNLELIQSSILAVSLEDNSPKDENELFKEGIAGIPDNRWFDKSITVIVFKNGLFASNNNHAPFDGMGPVTLTNYVDFMLQENDGRWKGSKEIRETPAPKELQFHLDTVLLKSIKEARQIYMSVANNYKGYNLNYPSFGRDFLRINKVHPDTFLQMALQYTYYKLYKRPASTYETATTRIFWHGRTETVRSCTMEAVEWCQAMLDPMVNSITRLKLLNRAMDKHNKLMGEAVKNQGCDRHLLGLLMMAYKLDLPIPQIYQDPAYVKSGGFGNFVLSTSCLGYTTAHGGTVAMVEHGYGCFYHLEEERCCIFVQSWRQCKKTDCREFAQMLSICLDDMKEILKGSNSTARL